MAIYRPSKNRKRVIEDALRDLDPATRELARIIFEDLLREEGREIDKEDLYRRIEELKKKKLIR